MLFNLICLLCKLVPPSWDKFGAGVTISPLLREKAEKARRSTSLTSEKQCRKAGSGGPFCLHFIVSCPPAHHHINCSVRFTSTVRVVQTEAALVCIPFGECVEIFFDLSGSFFHRCSRPGYGTDTRSSEHCGSSGRFQQA